MHSNTEMFLDMSSPVDAVAEITSPAPETPAPKKPRQSRAKKDDAEAPVTTEKADKESKPKATKRKATGGSHPPFEEIIRECISEATGDVREGVSRPAIKST